MLFDLLDQLQKAFFLIYIQRDYAKKHFFYEKNIHQKMKAVLRHKMTNRVEQLVEVVMSLGCLRYRVLDHSLFEVCEKELRAISDSLSECLKKPSEKKSQLLESIQKLDELYRSILQVMAPDPAVLLYFIYDLYDAEKLLAGHHASA